MPSLGAEGVEDKGGGRDLELGTQSQSYFLGLVVHGFQATHCTSDNAEGNRAEEDPSLLDFDVRYAIRSSLGPSVVSSNVPLQGSTCGSLASFRKCS